MAVTLNTVQQALQRALALHGGSPTAFAEAIGQGVRRQNLAYWLRCGVVPTQYCAAIERATNGAVRRWDLRPDDWHLIWPELVGTEGAPAVPEAQEVADAA